LEETPSIKRGNLISSILLSIIVPFADGSNTARFCEWVEKFDLSFTEIIVIHDGVDLKLREKVRTLTANSSVARSFLLVSASRNPGGSRNLGLGHANGTWVHFCDFDDLPNLPTIVSTLNSAPADTSVVVGQFRKIDFISKLVTQTSEDNSMATLVKEIGLWRCMFRFDVVKGHEFPESRMGEDQIFFLSINPAQQKIWFVNEIFYDYFVSDPNQLTAKNSNIQELYKSIETSFAIKLKDSRDSKIFFEVLFRLLITLMYKSKLSRPFALFFLSWRIWKHSVHLGPVKKMAIVLRICSSLVRAKLK